MGNLLFESKKSVRMRKLIYFRQYAWAGMYHHENQWTRIF